MAKYLPWILSFGNETHTKMPPYITRKMSQNYITIYASVHSIQKPTIIIISTVEGLSLLGEHDKLLCTLTLKFGIHDFNWHNVQSAQNSHDLERKSSQRNYKKKHRFVCVAVHAIICVFFSLILTIARTFTSLYEVQCNVICA